MHKSLWYVECRNLAFEEMIRKICILHESVQYLTSVPSIFVVYFGLVQSVLWVSGLRIVTLDIRYIVYK